MARKINFEMNMTNRVFYSLIAVGFLLALGIVAWAGSNSGVSHDTEEIDGLEDFVDDKIDNSGKVEHPQEICGSSDDKCKNCCGSNPIQCVQDWQNDLLNEALNNCGGEADNCDCSLAESSSGGDYWLTIWCTCTKN